MNKYINIVESTSDNVLLSENRFRKEIVKFGEWLYDQLPGGKFVMNKEKAEQVVKNFNEGVRKSLFVTKGHKKINEIDSDPNVIAGEVEKLEVTDQGIDAVFNTRDEKAANEIGKAYKDVSIALAEAFIDPSTGENKGPVLMHVALTSEPHIKNLEPFIALSEEIGKDTKIININNKQKMGDKKKEVNLNEQEMEKDESTGAESKNGEKEDNTPDESKSEGDNKKSEENETDEKKSENQSGNESDEKDDENDDIDTAELSEKTNDAMKRVKELEAQLAEQRKEKIEKETEILLSEGKILPVQKEITKSLLTSDSVVYLSEGKEETTADAFREFISKMPSLVELEEKGYSSNEGSAKLSEEEKEAFRFTKTPQEDIDKYLENKKKQGQYN